MSACMFVNGGAGESAAGCVEKGAFGCCSGVGEGGFNGTALGVGGSL